MSDKKVTRTYNLPRILVERIKQRSDSTMAPQSRIVEKAILEYLDRQDTQTKRGKA